MNPRPPFVAKDFAGHCKIFPERDVMLLPFQKRWVTDNSRLKICVKARQIGLSWCTAFRIVREKLRKGARLDAWISSRDEIAAMLFVADAKRFADVLNVAASDMGQNVIDDDGHTAFTLRFSNGLRIHSMSSNPDAQAGKRGDRVLDEFALHNDPKKLYEIAYPGIVWGGSLEIFSSHRGSANYFNELLREITERGNPKGFSLHKVTLEVALSEGLLFKLQQKLPENDERLAMDETDYFNFIRAGCADEESFLQEFMCEPADDNTAFLPFDLIAGCEYKEGEPWQTDLLNCINPLFIGVDIGREHDLTVIWLIEQVNDIRFTRRVIELSKQTFEAQEHALYDLLKLPAVRRCCIDQSGLGRQFAERAAKTFGGYKVEGVSFTTSIKEELAYPTRAAFEDRTIKVPFSNAVRADLRGVRREVTGSGHIRFAGERNRYCHCDRFWALSLALHAAKKPATGAISDPKVVRYGSNPGNTLLAPRRVFTPRTLQRTPHLGYFET
ncbi:MAG TPA: terminase family protein [Candidatus Udaeobacter sp.]|nr:terminase family protein [Candidatus Udaeobacter sp.]